MGKLVGPTNAARAAFLADSQSRLERLCAIGASMPQAQRAKVEHELELARETAALLPGKIELVRAGRWIATSKQS